jgi:hypothetical protein
MRFNPLAFMELFVVLAFAVGWLVLEIVSRRYDRKRREETKSNDERRTTGE